MKHPNPFSPEEMNAAHAACYRAERVKNLEVDPIAEIRQRAVVCEAEHKGCIEWSKYDILDLLAEIDRLRRGTAG